MTRPLEPTRRPVREPAGSEIREVALSPAAGQGSSGPQGYSPRNAVASATHSTGVIAHELRTPITVMRTLNGLLLDPASEPTDEQRRTMLETLGDSSDAPRYIRTERGLGYRFIAPT